jgi:hypothetical protein
MVTNPQYNVKAVIPIGASISKPWKKYRKIRDSNMLNLIFGDM